MGNKLRTTITMQSLRPAILGHQLRKQAHNPRGEQGKIGGLAQQLAIKVVEHIEDSKPSAIG